MLGVGSGLMQLDLDDAAESRLFGLILAMPSDKGLHRQKKGGVTPRRQAERKQVTRTAARNYFYHPDA